ncbi:hypothetical protein THAOC_07992, partial [Thalassiosira oceanica]
MWENDAVMTSNTRPTPPLRPLALKPDSSQARLSEDNLARTGLSGLEQHSYFRTGLICLSRPEHLPNYHRWMQDPFLLDATASEPLSMEEEITMQKEWRDDEHKCTFIILARDVLHGQCPDVPPCPCDNSSNERSSFPKLVEQTLQCMIGDINLFLSEEEEEEIDDEESFRRQQHLQNITQQVEMKPPELTQAELDLMIAESSHRRKNLGTELALMMMHYGASQLNIKRF